MHIFHVIHNQDFFCIFKKDVIYFRVEIINKAFLGDGDIEYFFWFYLFCL